uniref:2-alkenal reductase (NAD(P)(+)) n=1 Tax=Opuntia streptacantha TaxID=393608 RepID=A0A7C9DNF4_OPUST
MPINTTISLPSFSSLLFKNTSPQPPTSPLSTTTTTSTTPPPPRPPPGNPNPAMDAAEMKRLFNLFDRNGDGRISKGELTQSLNGMGIHLPDSDVAQMIRQVDSDGDGCVDSDEFQNLYRVIMEGRERDGGLEEDDIKEAFNVFDKNRDGFISPEELRSVLAALGLRRPHGGRGGGGKEAEIEEDDCRLMIMKVDVDGDGLVNFMEFKQMMMQGNSNLFSIN